MSVVVVVGWYVMLVVVGRVEGGGRWLFLVCRVGGREVGMVVGVGWCVQEGWSVGGCGLVIFGCFVRWIDLLFFHLKNIVWIVLCLLLVCNTDLVQIFNCFDPKTISKLI